jgi:hypothetical protein
VIELFQARSKGSKNCVSGTDTIPAPRSKNKKNHNTFLHKIKICAGNPEFLGKI